MAPVVIRAARQSQRIVSLFLSHSRQYGATMHPRAPLSSNVQKKNKITKTLTVSVKAAQAGYPAESGGEREPKKEQPYDKKDSVTPLVSKPLAILQLLMKGYNSALQKHPVTTKALTSLFGFAIGDYIAQSFASSGSFDPFRFLRMSLYGVLIDGPIGHYFYQFLDTKIYPEDPKCTKAVLTKTSVDQLIWAPVMTVVFLTFLTTLEGRPEAALDVVHQKLVPILIANFSVWPIAHLINFRFVPPEQRILFNNIVAIAWTTYLSWTCGAGTGGLDGHAGTPRDALAGGIPVCAAGAQAVLKTPHVVDMLRQTRAVENVLFGWGVDGLPDSTGSELLFNYFRLKAELLDTVCSARP